MKFHLDNNHNMPYCDKEHTVGANGQQGMLTPLRYLIQPITFYKFVLRCVALHLYLLNGF